MIVRSVLFTLTLQEIQFFPKCGKYVITLTNVGISMTITYVLWFVTIMCLYPRNENLMRIFLSTFDQNCGNFAIGGKGWSIWLDSVVVSRSIFGWSWDIIIKNNVNSQAIFTVVQKRLPKIIYKLTQSFNVSFNVFSPPFMNKVFLENAHNWNQEK